METLTDEQERKAVKAMREYLDAPPRKDGDTPVEDAASLDARRRTVLQDELRSLLAAYLSGEMPLLEFKPALDSLNKREPCLGFQGIKGQMFFNMVLNVTSDTDKLDAELKAAIAVPDNDEEDSRSRISRLVSYVQRIGDESVEAGGSKHSRPRVSSFPYFVSYFW